MKMRGLGHHLTDVTVTEACKIAGNIGFNMLLSVVTIMRTISDPLDNVGQFAISGIIRSHSLVPSRRFALE